MLNDASVNKVAHQLAGIPACLSLLLQLGNLKFQLVDIGILGPHHVLLLELLLLRFFNFSLCTPFLTINLQKVGTDALAH